MPTPLTAMSVSKAKPGKQRREISDGACRGLYLVVQPSGGKSWALRFRRPNGRPAKLTLGPVDLSGRESVRDPTIGAPLTLAAARALAAELHHERARKHDVVAIRRRQVLEAKENAAKTFKQAAIAFIEQHAKPNTRRWTEQARLLGLLPDGDELKVTPRGLVDRWGDRPLSDITGDDIYDVVDETRERGAPGLERRRKGQSEARARAMFATLSKLFGWLIEKRRVAANPCANVVPPRAPAARDRILSNTEIRSFWAACEKANPPFGSLLKVLLLTGCRLNEVAGARHSEMSDDGATWTIPGHRTKNHRAHVVSLSRVAREIVAGAAAGGDHVFTTTGTTPVSGWSKIKARLDTAMIEKMREDAKAEGLNSAKCSLPAWRLHDLRRTCATGMAEIGIAPHIIEACLNHISGAKAGVAGIYNRAAYADEKKAALERWAAHISDLIERRPPKVIPMTSARR